MPIDVLRDGVAAFAEVKWADAAFLPAAVPVAWTRLEPQSVTGEQEQALAVRVHDPLWLIARQWQFGEFAGEDAGTPVAVELEATARRFTAFKPDGLAAQPMNEGHLIEPEIEAEPFKGATFRERAEGGALLAAMLSDAGVEVRPALMASCPLLIPPELLAQSPLWLMLARGGIDGTVAAAQIEDESFTGLWAAGIGTLAMQAARNWLGWFRKNIEPLETHGDCWLPQRLEYGFSLRAGGGDDQRVLRAVAHDGGAVEWFSFDHHASSQITLEGEAGETAPVALAATVHATRLRYAGMPSSRLWRFEDGQVNFGMVDVQPHDLARLAFLDFATVHADDWLVAPLDVPRGSAVEMKSVAYRTTFNERFSVDQGNTGPNEFELFSLASPSGATLQALVIPPAGRTTTEGPAVEEVVFARDETANLVWAIEKSVQDAGGDPRDRRLERLPPLDFATAEGADLTYRIETEIPPWWIPMVPVASGSQGGFHLRKGSLSEEDASVGRILAPTPLDIFEEEVPREGVVVRRVPSLVRDNQGHLRRWVARRVSIARGEANSALAWDSTLRK